MWKLGNFISDTNLIEARVLQHLPAEMSDSIKIYTCHLWFSILFLVCILQILMASLLKNMCLYYTEQFDLLAWNLFEHSRKRYLSPSETSLLLY